MDIFKEIYCRVLSRLLGFMHARSKINVENNEMKFRALKTGLLCLIFLSATSCSMKTVSASLKNEPEKKVKKSTKQQDDLDLVRKYIEKNPKRAFRKLDKMQHMDSQTTWGADGKRESVIFDVKPENPDAKSAFYITSFIVLDEKGKKPHVYEVKHISEASLARAFQHFAETGVCLFDDPDWLEKNNKLVTISNDEEQGQVVEVSPTNN